MHYFVSASLMIATEDIIDKLDHLTDPAEILHLMFIIFGFCMFFTLIFGFAGVAVGSFRDSKRRANAISQTVASYPAEGIILDAQLVQDPPGTAEPLHYKYSIRYADTSGTPHRALLGISSREPIYFAAGQAVQLHILQQSVIVPDTDAFNPARSATGTIDCPVSFRKWLGKPIDETGTVMLETDYQAVTAQMEKEQKSRHTLGIIMIFCAAVSLIITICTALAFIWEF